MSQAQSFHTRAVTWLRTQPSIELAIDARPITDPDDAALARIHGTIVPDHVHRRATVPRVMLLFVLAGVAGLLAERAGIGATVRNAAGLTAVLSLVAAFALLVSDALRLRRLRVALEVQIHARTNNRQAPLSAERIPARVQPDAELWLVVEAGIAADVLAELRRDRVRCFVLRDRRFVEP